MPKVHSKGLPAVQPKPAVAPGEVPAQSQLGFESQSSFESGKRNDDDFEFRQKFLARARKLSPEQQERFHALTSADHATRIVAGYEAFQSTSHSSLAHPTKANTPDCSTLKTYVETSLRALSSWSKPAEDTAVTVGEPQQVERALGDFRRMLSGPSGYSVEEIRRLLLPDYPFLSRSFVESVVRPAFADELKRYAPERWGEEKNFHLATHLANFMLGLPAGTDEASAVAQFKADIRESVREYAPSFNEDDLRRLQLLYPFVPRWENGVKSEADFSLAWTSQPDSLDFSSWAVFQAVRDQLAAAASIPLVDPLLRAVSWLRAPPPLMRHATLNEVTGVFSDSIPRMYEHLRVDGLSGARVNICGKHYSAAPMAVDLLRRVFGAHVDVVKGDAEVAAWVVDSAKKAVAEAKGPIIEHIEGVLGVSEQIAKLQAQHPDVPIIQISHTTSDSRDMVKNVGEKAPHLVQLMGLSQSKEVDENERFRLTFTALIIDLTKALGAPLFEYAFAVMGYGKIIGPAAAAALDGLSIQNRLVVDPSEERRMLAKARRQPAAPTLAPLAGQAVVVMSGAGGRTVGREELAHFAGRGKPVVLVSLGSGRGEFDMEWIEEQARLASSATQGSPLPAPRIIGSLGREPIWEYNIRVDGKRLQLIIPANGYVANLAQLHPTPAPYAATTPLLILEAMRQGVFRRCVLDERGLKELDSLAVHIHRNSKGTQQRHITLYDFIGTEQHQLDPDEVKAARTSAERMLESAPNSSLVIQKEEGWWDPVVELPDAASFRRLL